MPANYLSNGYIIPVNAPYDLGSGEPFAVNALFGIAQAAAASGSKVEAATVGVYALPKVLAEVWGVGTPLYWAAGSKKCTVAASGNLPIGVAIAAADNTQATGYVRLNGMAAAAAAQMIFGGNRSQVPYIYFGTGNANNVKQNRIMVRAPLNQGVKNIRLTNANWYANASGGESSSNLLQFNLKQGIEYPLGTFYRVKYNDADTKLMDLGETVLSDPAAVEVPPGAIYYIRTFREHLGVTGSYNDLVNQIITPGRNEAAMSGTNAGDDRTISGTITAASSLNQVYGPLMIHGEATSPGANVVIISDSIGRGSGDKTGTTGQGDYLSGTSPTAPYINIGNLGWIERAIGGRNALMNIAVPSKTSAAFTEVLNVKQFEAIDRAPPTHVVICVGVNDLLTGVTGAQVIARIQAIMAMARARWNGPKCYVGTIMPATNSTDTWATIGNQSLAGVLTATGTTPSWSNFTATDGSSGRSYVNAQIRGNLIGADGIIDGSAQVEHSGDSRLWRVDLGTPTTDGLHPQPVLHTQAATALNPATLFG